MPSAGDRLFEREDEIELWRSIGIRPHVVMDQDFHAFVSRIASILYGWIGARRRGLKSAALANRLNAAGHIAAPGHLWDAYAVERLLEIDHALQPRQATKLEPSSPASPPASRTRAYAGVCRPPRAPKGAFPDWMTERPLRIKRTRAPTTAGSAWLEEVADIEGISSPYFRRKLARLRREREPQTGPN